MATEICYTCEFYEDALCGLSDNYDDEDPNTFKCSMFEYDEEKGMYYD